MRCKACNSMIGVWKNPRSGQLEDLCSRCRSWIYVGLDEDYRRSDEHTATCTVDELHDLGLDIELDEDNIMDRNHEFDSELFEDNNGGYYARD